MEAEKRTIIALFDGFTFMQDVPDGCPDEYAKTDFSNRRAFARWLERYGNEFLYDGTEKISPYPYYIYYKGQDNQFEFRVAIVPVDLSRPWLIHWTGGREKIWYLDQKDDYNQVKPSVEPQVISYGFGGDTCVVRK